jgi:quercetin dioxygenase-like cupin family protein
MHVTRAADRRFHDAGVPGIERGRIWVSGHGVAVDGTDLCAGDYAFTEPGEWHEVTALQDCVVLLSFGQSA